MDEDTSACDDQFDTNVNQEMNKENTVIQNESSPMVCDTVENVQWTPDKDVELCKEMIKNLKGIKIKAKANKKEESTSILKRMTDMFKTKFQDERCDLKDFFKQLENISTKWLSYNRTSFKSNYEKDIDELIRIIERIKFETTLKLKTK